MSHRSKAGAPGASFKRHHQDSKVRRQAYRVLVCTALLTSELPAPAVAQSDTWTGKGGNPFWDVATNWSSGEVPTSSDTAIIGSRYTPNYRSGTDTIAGLNDSGGLLVSGDSLTISGSSFVSKGLTVSGGGLTFNGSATVGSLTLISGVLAVNSTATVGSLTESGGQLGGTGTTTISGASTWTGGEIGTSSDGSTVFKGSLGILGDGQKQVGGGTLTTAGTTTWSGNSAAGNNYIEVGGYGVTGTINNTGIWLDKNAYQANIALEYGAGGQFNNSGTYTKSGNSSETAIGAAFNNTGTVNVSNGLLALYGGGTSTGTFNPTGTGIVDLDGGAHTLTGIKVTGTGVFEIDAGSATQTGTTTDTGKLSVIGSGSLNVNGTWTAASFSESSGALGGTGTTTISGASTWTGGEIGTSSDGSTVFKGSLGILGDGQKQVGGGTLTTAGTTTWSGNSAAGNNYIEVGGYGVTGTINNTGIWLDKNAYQANIALEYGAGGQFNNSGTYTKSGNSSETDIGVAFDNAGTVSVNAGTLALSDLTNFSGTTLTKGTFNVSSTLEFAGANIVTNAANLTLTGTASAILNSISADANGLAGFSTNAATGSFSVEGGRNFTAAGKFTNQGRLNVGAGSKFTAGAGLTNFSATTLSGGTYGIAGTLEFKGADIVTNSAAITLSGKSSQILNSSGGGNALANLATNSVSGAFSIQNGRLFAASGNFVNAGSVSIGTGSSFTTGASATYKQSAGKTIDDGTLTAGAGVSLLGGSLFGTGTIAGNLKSSAIVTPGNSATSTGILSEKGTYSQTSTGTLNIAIGGTSAGTQFDELKSTTAQFAGTLNLQLIGGYVPTIGSTFKIIDYNSESGQFAKVNGLAINNTEHFSLSYQGSDLLTTVVSGPESGSTYGGGFRDLGDSRTRIVKESSLALLNSTSNPRGRVETAMRGAGAIGAASSPMHIPQSQRPLQSRPKVGGKVAAANLQFSFLSLLSRPLVSLGVN